MPRTLPYYPFIAHWVPGFITLSFLTYPFIKHIGCNPSEGMAMIIIFFFIAIALATGQIIDAFTYSIIEPRLKKRCPLDWDIFAKKEKRDERMKNRYFANYVFDINLTTGLIIGVIWFLIYNVIDLLFFVGNVPRGYFLMPILTIIVILLISFLLVKDAKNLRKKMADIVSKEKNKSSTL